MLKIVFCGFYLFVIHQSVRKCVEDLLVFSVR